MIIDAHAHTNGGNLGNYKANLLASRALARAEFHQNEDQLRTAVQHHMTTIMDKVGTDMQFLSPRPFQLMHSESPTKVVHYYCQASNDVNAMTVKIAPERYRAVAALPQVPTEPISTWIPELERCVNELGMIGLMINPDPFEGTEEFPGMGEEAWYPLYEKMVELDVPALIHSATTKKQYDYYQNYFITTETSCILQMVEKRVFNTFPNLKIIVSHGGGSIPYQIGRWRSNFGRMMGLDFDEELKKFYFDTVLYNQEALDLLFRIVGTDRCMFGTENPGTGTWFDPKKGRLLDDIKPDIDAIDWLTDQDRKNIFEDTARKVFTRYKDNP
jgi:predicted TIM-barrel fold metal-dependent hydrolase